MTATVDSVLRPTVTDADIAPMFANAPDNCDLPEGWRIVPPATPEEPRRDE